MIDKDTQTRRTVLKGLAVGTTALSVPASGKPTENGRSLAKRRIFLESTLGLNLPASVERTGRLTAADVLVVSANTTVPRGRLVSSLTRGAPITFVGDGADDALAAFLYDVQPSGVADAARTSSLEKPSDLSASFGVEYDRNSRASVAVAWPRGSTIDTHQFSTDNPSNEYVLSKIDRTFALNDATTGSLTTTDAGASDVGATAYTCPDSEDGWNCLGRSHEEKDLAEHGQIEKFVWGAKATNETDPYHDYFSWKTKLSMTPGKALGRSDWMNDYILRTVDFEDELAKHGPPSTSGSSTSSFSVGVDVGVSASGPDIGGSLGWGWSTTHSHTSIEETIDLVEEKATHKYDLTFGENVSETTFNAYPGYRVDPANGTNTANYSYEADWFFRDDHWYGDDTYKYHMYGDGSWTA